jgi:hypothetical protein
MNLFSDDIILLAAYGELHMVDMVFGCMWQEAIYIDSKKV